MIGLDLDGTSMRGFGQMSPAVREAIEAALQAGIVVLPATGRQLTGVPEVFLSIPGVRYALTSNGAKIQEVPSGTVVYENCFDAEDAARLLQFFTGFDTLPGMYIDGRGYNETIGETLQQALPQDLLDYLARTRIVVPSLAAMLTPGTKVEKFTLQYSDMAERERMRQALQALPGICVTSSVPWNLEINTATANKGAGLVALGERLGIQPGQIMAVGDSYNDIEMLRAVGYSVAMGNAEPEVKEIADAITLPCQEDGVAAAIWDVLGR